MSEHIEPAAKNPLIDFYTRTSIVITHGKGIYLYTARKIKYLDCAAGYAANSLGYSHPKLVRALKKQAGKCWHLCNHYPIEGTKEYATDLVNSTFGEQVYLCNTGAEAVESALKFARRYHAARHNAGTKAKWKFITAEGSFHGRTLACASASSKEKMEGFGPRLAGFVKVPFMDFEKLEHIVRTDEEIAGIMLEPIQGEGGIRPHTKEYLRKVRDLCDQHDILLIFDEVQCGMGRTGKLYAYQHFGIHPDLMALAKGLGGGFPVAATVATSKVSQYLEKGSHGSTFGGNPLAIAVGSTVFKILNNKSFLQDVTNIAELLRQKLEDLAHKYPICIAEIRGLGLMQGIKLHQEYNADLFVKLLEKYKVLTIPASDNVIRITPPLIFGKKHVKELCKALDLACKEIQQM